MQIHNALKVVNGNGAPSQHAAAPSPKGFYNRDPEIAQGVVAAMRQLNVAMETASKAGLIVEPSFSKTSSRFGDLGVAKETFIVNVKVFRKLC